MAIFVKFVAANGVDWYVNPECVVAVHAVDDLDAPACIMLANGKQFGLALSPKEVVEKLTQKRTV